MQECSCVSRYLLPLSETNARGRTRDENNFVLNLPPKHPKTTWITLSHSGKTWSDTFLLTKLLLVSMPHFPGMSPPRELRLVKSTGSAAGLVHVPTGSRGLTAHSLYRCRHFPCSACLERKCLWDGIWGLWAEATGGWVCCQPQQGKSPGRLLSARTLPALVAGASAKGHGSRWPRAVEAPVPETLKPRGHTTSAHRCGRGTCGLLQPPLEGVGQENHKSASL